MDAVQLYRAGKYAEAAAAWSELAQTADDAASHLTNAATCKMELGLYRGALKQAESAIALTPHHLRSHQEREGGVKVELKPRAGRTEGLGGIRGFLAFPGRIRTRGGPFRVLSGTRRPSKIHPLPRV